MILLRNNTMVASSLLMALMLGVMTTNNNILSSSAYVIVPTTRTTRRTTNKDDSTKKHSCKKSTTTAVLLSSSSSSSSSPDLQKTDNDEADDESWDSKTKRLCEERNIKFGNIKNARDLASVRDSPIIPGRIYRTGRLSDASEDDIRCIREELKLKTLIDLRSPTELKDDPTLMRPQVFREFTSMVWRENSKALLKSAATATSNNNNHNNNGQSQPRGLSSSSSSSSSSSRVLAAEGSVRELKQEESPVRGGGIFKRTKRNDNNETTEEDYDAAAAAVAAYTACIDSAIVDDTDAENNIDEIATFCKLQYEVDMEYCDDDDDDNDNNNNNNKRGGYVRVSDVRYTGDRKERLFVSLMNELKYVRGTLSKLRKRDLARSLLKTPGTIFSRRVRNSFKKPFLDKINGGGLPLLNELLLRYGSPGIKYVLEICADEARHPVAFYCTAGKDRTGMIAAILLSLCGADRQSIVEDYSLSDNVYAEMNDHKAMVGALSQRSLDPKTFLCAPPHVMENTLDIIDEQYGSVEGYCNWIGFGPEKQQRIRDILMINKGNNI